MLSVWEGWFGVSSIPEMRRTKGVSYARKTGRPSE